ncbi:MAG: glycosyl hydrolase, partial [Bacteroidota bacterium]
QDNSTIRIAHRTDGFTISEKDWESTAGGESAHIAPDPDNPDIVYGGSYGGYLTRINHATGERRAINVWPDNPMGHGAEGMKYRFQWNFPIFFSPHNSKKLYTASNHLHVSTDEGQSWKIISPDLTRNDSSKLVSSGGPITQDNTGVEYYCTIFAALESPYEKDLLWAGSDDGLIHISRDAGANWKNVTPPDLPEWIMINSIDADPFVKGGAYVAATMYKSGNYEPFLYKTKDYGKTWTKIVDGIDKGHFTRVVRADPARKGLLYAGTETGMYVSFDDGASWKPFQMNLPVVPITDLAIKNHSLIVATQGRSLWMIDDLTPLHQLSDEIAKRDFVLFKPKDSYRMGGSGAFKPKNAGQNHPTGVMLYYYLNEWPADSVAMEMKFLTKSGELIRSIDARDKKNKRLFQDAKAGMNRLNWDLRYDGAKKFDGMILWWGNTQGPKAVPGTYLARMIVGKDSMEQEFTVLKDPRSSATQSELEAQFDHLMVIRNKLTETHEVIKSIRDTRKQIKGFTNRIKDAEGSDPILASAKRIDSVMTNIEKTLYQTKNRSGQDPLNFPIRLNNKLAHVSSLSSIGDFPPTQQAVAFTKEVMDHIDTELSRWYELTKTDIPAFNELVREQKIDFIQVPKVEDDMR